MLGFKIVTTLPLDGVQISIFVGIKNGSSFVTEPTVVALPTFTVLTSIFDSSTKNHLNWLKELALRVHVLLSLEEHRGAPQQPSPT